MMAHRVDPAPSKWWRGIGPGDKVWYSTAHGNQKYGIVTIAAPTHVVLNTGGKHGTPAVVNENNFLSHRALTAKQRNK